MLQRKEEELVKRQAIERRALPKRIRAERKARDMMFRESLRISTQLDPDGEREKLKKVNFITNTHESVSEVLNAYSNLYIYSSRSKRRSATHRNSNGLISSM